MSLVYEKAAFSGCIWHGVFKDVSLPSSFDFYAVVEILDCDNQIQFNSYRILMITFPSQPRAKSSF